MIVGFSRITISLLVTRRLRCWNSRPAYACPTTPVPAPTAPEAPAAPTDVTALTDTLVGRGGPIANMYVEHTWLSRLSLWTCRLELGDLRTITASNAPQDWWDAEGRGQDRDEAVLGAVGEAVERYATALAGLGAPLTVATADELGDRAVPPRRFTRMSDAERHAIAPQAQGATSGSVLGWFPGHDVRDGTPALLPAQTVLTGYTALMVEDELRAGGSKGLAAHRTPEDAILHAACEIIEADAFMITYLNRLPVPEIDLGTVTDPMVDSLRQAAGTPRLTSVRAWDITTDCRVPSVLAAVDGNSAGRRLMTCSCATAPDPTVAVRKAVLEAVHTQAWLDAESVDTASAWPWERVLRARGRRDHKLLGSHPAYLDRLDWLLGKRETISVQDMAALPGGAVGERLDAVADRAHRTGMTLYAADLTPPDIAEATGLCAWRVVSPEAQPFALAPVRYLVSDRLRHVPVRLNYRSGPSGDTDLTAVPHFCP